MRGDQYGMLFVLYEVPEHISVEAAGTDDVKLKEAIKSYQYAAGLFDKIKNEITQCVSDKELSNDLRPNYMTYCSCLCIAYAQKNLITVAENKKQVLLY